MYMCVCVCVCEEFPVFAGIFFERGEQGSIFCIKARDAIWVD